MSEYPGHTPKTPPAGMGRPPPANSRVMTPDQIRINASLGLTIRHLRRLHGLSLEVVAGAIGVSYQQMQKYECGKNRISALRLSDIANLLGTTPGVLLAQARGEAVATPGVRPALTRSCLVAETEEEENMLLSLRRVTCRRQRSAVLLWLRLMAGQRHEDEAAPAAE